MKRTMAVVGFCSVVALGLGLGMAQAQAQADQPKKPFGGPDSVAYAADLWKAMEQMRLVGDQAITGTPYEGMEPHGAILETFDAPLTIDGHTGTVIVKRNHGPSGITTEDVLAEPKKHLKAVTVMFQREAGYDSANQDWFWAKYRPDGSLDTNPKGDSLAGRVAKGMNAGCIACHKGAGEDMVFTRDR